MCGFCWCLKLDGREFAKHHAVSWINITKHPRESLSGKTIDIHSCMSMKKRRNPVNSTDQSLCEDRRLVLLLVMMMMMMIIIIIIIIVCRY